MASRLAVIANGMNVTLLDVGVEFTYTVPSFSVFEAKLRQSTVNIENDDGVFIYDCFLQANASLPERSSSMPFYITILKHCFVPVSLY